MRRNNILYPAFLNKTIEHNDSILVALSGGADSVALLHSLCQIKDELKLTIYAAHLNHSIRTDASHDEEFCRVLCKDLNIVFISKTVDIPTLSKELHKSEESIGRIERYKLFDEVMQTYQIKKLATAHHANDNAESIMLHFLRGSGLGGLIGIKQKQNNLIRPLLSINRKEIEAYVTVNNLSFCTDSTNFESDYTRNFLRLKILPLIENGINQNIIKTLTRNARNFELENDFIEQEAEAAYKSSVSLTTIDIKTLTTYHPAIIRRVIRRLLFEVYGTSVDIYDIYITDIEKLIKKHSTGKHINLPSGYVARVERYRLIIESN